MGAGQRNSGHNGSYAHPYLTQLSLLHLMSHRCLKFHERNLSRDLDG